VRGDNPPEDLRRNFVDSTGQFRRDIYDQFLSNPNQFLQDPEGSDPNYGSRWLAQYEENLRRRREQEKLQSLILASVRVPEGEVREKFEEQNIRYEALFASFDAGTLVKDEDIQLTDADVRSYYDEHLDQYRTEAARSVHYVLFPEKPSASDSSARWKDIDEVAMKARAGMPFFELAATYGERVDSGAFYRRGELTPRLDSAAFAAKPGTIVGPLADAEGLHVLSVMEERGSDREVVRASHILLPMEGGTDTTAVRRQAMELLRSARSGSDFPTLALANSKDPASAQRGGDLGWFPRGRMTPAFETAAFGAKPGDIVGPVRTPFGLHIIKVTGRENRDVKVAAVTLRIEPSPQTENDLFERARDFAYNSRETAFSTEAQQLGLEIRESRIQEKGGVIPGIGVNPSITRWAFNNKVGSVSEPFPVEVGTAVFTIVKAEDAGVRPFDEVKESIRPLALREKKIDKVLSMAAELRGTLTPGDSLMRVRDLDPSIPVRTTGQVTLNAAVPGVGRDMQFLGTLAGLDPGEISPAVRSTRGAFLIQLQSRSPFDSTAYASQRESIRARLLQEKRSRYMTDWLEGLKAEASIEDNRDIFFR
jgi:parvulin-like peptidyl-prolyl isomerase